jgi:hypothetical protein
VRRATTTSYNNLIYVQLRNFARDHSPLWRGLATVNRDDGVFGLAGLVFRTLWRRLVLRLSAGAGFLTWQFGPGPVRSLLVGMAR